MLEVATHLWFEDKAQEAAEFYVGLVAGSAMGEKTVIPADTPSGPAGAVYQVEFTLAGQRFVALNAGPLDPFNHSFSIVVECDDQAEVDRLWDALADGGAPEQCGWLKDRYGVCWQIVPRGFAAMMADPDKRKAARAVEAMLSMVKFDIAKLQAAFDGA